ncbi:N-acetylneuraminate synthase family protein [Dorea formicigenerans]|jgi:sialic acid synthase SpsE|uniref:Acetylneuraminic acid synthetase n=1 Tax=Dorea formicigenerans TaxID=39486 RepID=A0A412EZT1_9FIRM|nr:N-acetylneuraminate synthase family protein [Dorea formicigenerans]RGR58477.1 acetylneuraminic acid synthetase [Dorea formicigenerans]
MRTSKPYVIAEMGVNFYDTAKALNISPLEAAKLYIDKAADAGVDCAKFQSYKADTIVSKNSPAYWDLTKEPTKTQHALFKKHDSFNEDDYKILCDYTHEKGMDFTSTPFDYNSADFLENMVDFYKISSSDLSNLPFIRHIGSKGKPVYISVGASYLSEVDEAIRVLKESGCEDIVILHCVLSYPTDPGNANLRVIETLKKVFPDVRVGFSDHVAPDDTMMTLATAYLLGAEVIEKHFTLDKTLQGNDHYHAGDPEDFRRAINNFKWIDTVLGRPEKTILECEETPRREARRSLVLTRNMKAGEVITESDIMAKRPGTGIAPKFTDIVIGRTIRMDLEEDTVLTWEMV